MNSLEKNEREDKLALRISFLFAVFVLLLSFGLPKAEAYPVIIEIEAVVEYVEDDGPGDGYLEGKIDVDDIITGYYTYESTTEDSSPLDPIVGHYNHDTPTAGIFISVGGFEFQTDPCNVDFLVGIVNDNLSGDDIYWIHSYNNLKLSNGATLESIYWQLNDSTATALIDDSLPISAPILGQWQSNHLRIESERQFIIDALVTSAVPEPSTIFLVGLGAIFAKTRTRIKRVE